MPQSDVRSLVVYIESLIQEGLDLSWYSNEADGFRETFEVDYPEGAEPLEALKLLARQSPTIAKVLKGTAHIPYSPRDLAQNASSYQPLMEEGSTYQGYWQSLHPEDFAESISAAGRERTVEGNEILQNLQQCIEEIAVLAIHDQPLDESVEALHLCGGKNRYSGKLQAFLLERVWT